MKQPKPLSDPATVRQALQLLFAPGQLVELRAIGTRKGTVSGYFDDFERLTPAAASWSGRAKAVYVSLNELSPDLRFRAYNRVELFVRETTNDKQIIRRRLLLIDFDPVRFTGISSTDEEHRWAIERAIASSEWLRTMGWPQPTVCDSGNGAHLIYHVLEPVDEDTTTLCARVLKAVALQFDDERVTVDQDVFTLCRMVKLPGTMACKGDDLPERPHRISRVLVEGDRGVLVTREQLVALSLRLPREKQEVRPEGRGGAVFDLSRALTHSGWDMRGPVAWNGGQKWILHTCPWNPAHTDRSAYVVQFPSGAIDAGCHHNGCRDRGWADLRDLLDAGWRERKAEREEAWEERKERKSARIEEPPHPADADLTAHPSHMSLTSQGRSDSERPKPASLTSLTSLSAQRRNTYEAPSELPDEAYFGVAGEIVKAISPHTETSDAAILISFLVGMACLLGRRYYVYRDGMRHYANEFACLVGLTAAGRKGTAARRVEEVLNRLNSNTTKLTHVYERVPTESDLSEPDDSVRRSQLSDRSDRSDRSDGSDGSPLFPRGEGRFSDLILTGLGSGEAMVEALADMAEDRRRIVIEEEFSKPLKVMRREGSTLSENLRAAWDGGILANRTKGRQLRAEETHLCVMGHITEEELLKEMTAVDKANGFANRFLWFCTSRSKSLPLGGGHPDIAPLVLRLQQVLGYQSTHGAIEFDGEAMLLWTDGGIYELLTDRPKGAFGNITTRAAAHVTRLSLTYALLDCDREIKLEHLMAALGVWEYAERSCRYLFGQSSGDRYQDTIREVLAAAYPDGMTRLQLRDQFGRHAEPGAIPTALRELAERGLVARHEIKTAGRSAEYWVYEPNGEQTQEPTGALEVARRWCDGRKGVSEGPR